MPCRAGPTQIAQVIQNVSGLAHWKDEAAAAMTELERTRAALASISSNVRRLVSLPAALACKLAGSCKTEPHMWPPCMHARGPRLRDIHVGFRQEGAVATDQLNCAALAALEEQTAQLANTSQQLAAAIMAARDAASTKLADLQTMSSDLQVVTRLASRDDRQRSRML